MKRTLRQTVYFIDFDWVFLFVNAVAFLYLYIFFSFAGIPLFYIVWRLLRSAKKKDPEFFRAMVGAIKGKVLRGENSPWQLFPVEVDLQAPAEPQETPVKAKKEEKPRTVIRLLKGNRPLSQIALLRQ